MASIRMEVQYSTIEIFQSVLEYTHKGTNKQIRLDDNSLSSEVSKSKFYQDGTSISRHYLAEKQPHPIIQVVDGDCINHALKLKSEGYNPIVLNMANAVIPGGAYLDGAGGQEENLFRRTNLFQYLEQKKNECYPIPSYGGIYCPNSTVIRASEQENYEFLENPEKLSFVTVAAICQPQLVLGENGEYTLNEHDKETTRRKIRTMLNIGLDNGHDTIVLSAFGCGAFSNPPSTMARLFYEIISKEYFGEKENLPKTYKNISFAIFDDEGARQWKNNEGNFIPFKKVFANGISS
ncbi:2643_t:CDS:2 [Funneliformis caledonium]|uniref:2643_t:CDS:1 n=2 Tax=Funneliformis TaxID=1117308 RepID=A0A9N9CUA4_9GLOM|nr:7672_t:CDS:2 [Funneliformis mosseae]CAG8612072.1 2643_t:CDS:2 [Funneliformis caledonium]